jgi:RHH-type proline utilization regulon transcriptional repressor/proline dehydrogenase/delta 1-pyrroline-5-carboxylate dehydrogenase
MKEMGRQFVLGTSMEKALGRAEKMQRRGYTYSYDMLGESARTAEDAERYRLAYQSAIAALVPHCHGDVRDNPGISVKLSALFPRYEYAQRERVLEELVPRVSALAQQAAAANMGFNIDAEEADRLDLSMDIIEGVVKTSKWGDWLGFGVVVQSYGKRASFVLDWLYQLAQQTDKQFMVRLVKGAYWDSEIKRAQVMGVPGYPVFTRKGNTDISYLACARQLFAMADRIYPQFATHNAHTVAAVMAMAGGVRYEFQRLHGMGESLYRPLVAAGKIHCRIYAPVGAHSDLLAYLVRRLLENGANSSFVHQLVDASLTPEMIAVDPLASIEGEVGSLASRQIPEPAGIFGASRRNAKGWDLTDPNVVEPMLEQRAPFMAKQWQAHPLLASDFAGGEIQRVRNPANHQDDIGHVQQASHDDIDKALAAAEIGHAQWQAMPIAERVAAFQRLADAMEQHFEELSALACREAGKSLPDAVAEVREAVDFARYYATEIADDPGRGTLCCISPWNFPLAIFIGQCLGALAAGNAVVAKPAEQTPIMAFRAVELMHAAGIPVAAMQLLPGPGSVIGQALTSDPRVKGVCFTGSTATAQRIHRNMAATLAPNAALIAETGGLNAMIVDSTALPEQVVRDVMASAFQSAGQRCSALRVLYLQEDIADKVIEMLVGAMDELVVGDPQWLSTDVGPVIDEAARARIQAHVDAYAQRGQLIKQSPVPKGGTFVGPALIRIDSIGELCEEIFGPVLHIVTFAAKELERVVEGINASGFGLTFGLHTRLDFRVKEIGQRIKAGNIYINRNQIGAVVGSQPFGGEGLSGTGPKAGGPLYVARMRSDGVLPQEGVVDDGEALGIEFIQGAIDRLLALSATHQATSVNVTALPGPTGELNLYSVHGRGLVLCLGPTPDEAVEQAEAALAAGNSVLVVVQASDGLSDVLVKHALIEVLSGCVTPEVLIELQGIKAVAWSGGEEAARQYRVALAKREGEILPLVMDTTVMARYQTERHMCIDTTAAGGNASLIASAE